MWCLLTFDNLACLFINMLFSTYNGHHALHFSHVIFGAMVLLELLPRLEKSNALWQNVSRQCSGDRVFAINALPRP